LLDKHPKDPAVLILAGTVQEKAGKDSSAITSFRKLIELKPDFYESYFLLALVQNKTRNISDAVENLKKTLSLNPEYIPALAVMAEIKGRTGNIDDALEYIGKIKKLEPELHKTYELEGDILFERKKYNEAEIAYSTAFKKQMSSRLAVRLFQTREKLGLKNSIDSITMWLEKSPEDHSTRMVLASAMDRASEYKKAAEHYIKIIEAQPDNLVALNNIAWIYHKMGNNQSLMFAERAYKKGANIPEIVDTFGWILVEHGKTEKGLVYLQEAISKAPHLPEIRYHLAVAFAKNSRYKEAIQELKYLLREHRKFAYANQAKELLTKLEASQ
ncbi:MAG: tetratricopeptide repeat protein, partial [Nitrosopumilus sp.]|nr:tetratricopeptide repeat protein [Nitrosopumilus sp.]